ncbi:carbon-monoxide dehydrogenase medium subunit [Rhodopseudomonas palustris]|uniref:FAD binding domain-containing protein n=1 Tax=Rhodopseudomonas palustris TaxID=1076 RepID=UPI000D19C749|nr:FAD binding domain-containing protein [Rhodopseudomonas palustris]AVT76109.1 carbon-monoxide dehydrogenase medium subunit [Rhodopseudomonas palustris]
MKPAPFDYARPRDLTSALALLASNAGAKVMAGGQSLGPMLNLRLAQPEQIVDITAIDELKQAEIRGDELVLGACVTHADIEDGRVPDVSAGAMRSVAANIAYRAVRNRGTIGGSLSHADPAADWVSVLTALGARVTLRSASASRQVSLSEFIVGALQSCLQPGELVAAIHIPKRSGAAHWGYVKACRKTGEFAHGQCAALIDPGAGSARIVIGALDAAPVLIAKPAELFGGRVDADYKTRFDPRVADRLLNEAGVTDAVHRHIHLTVLKRALQEAA